MSFNINQFSGHIPREICDIPAGSGSGTAGGTDHDCRIGHDTDLSAYNANYPWIVNVTGNRYDCGNIPACARFGSCNKTTGTKIINPVSKVECN